MSAAGDTPVPSPFPAIAGYRIEAEIGRGGMGVVYRAEDLKLGRAVAIKVLAPKLSDVDGARTRLLNEARAASRLDSPYICTVYQVDETAEGQLYIAMAYYEGETLAAKLSRGLLSAERATGYALQIAAGLAVAHEAGIVHRDIKPANILIDRRDGVKLLDFGLAKILHQIGTGTTGSSGGTPAYMAPEQIRGEPAEPRTDIWSLGIVLAEMVSGRRPFKGEGAQVVMFNILHSEPIPLSELMLEAPADLERIVARAVVKDPLLRYQSIHELRQDLDPALAPTFVSTGPAPVATGVRSVLVLPFDNLSPNADDAYFGDGLTEEIITDLSAVQGLRVISRTSAMRLKGSSKDLRSIARELNVKYVLEGSVRKREQDFRIAAKLVDAAADSLVWADKYSGRLEDVFTVQETLSRKIVEALALKLDARAESKIASRQIDDARAYDDYLRAKQEMLRYNVPGLDRALAFLQKSERAVGQNVLLTAAIGQVYWQYVNAGVSGTESYLSKAREYAEKARLLDSDSPHCQRLLGLLSIYDGRIVDAVTYLRRATERDAGDTESMAWLVSYYSLLGLPHLAAPLAQRMIELDPLTPIFRLLPGFAALMAGDFEGALEPMRAGYEADRGSAVVRFSRGHALLMAGRIDDGCAFLDDLRRDDPENFFAALGALACAAVRGDAEGGSAAAVGMVLEAAHADPQYSWVVAQCYAMLGDRAEAVRWLRRAIEIGFTNYPLLAEKDPMFQGIRAAPEFQALLGELRPRWEELKATFS